MGMFSRNEGKSSHDASQGAEGKVAMAAETPRRESEKPSLAQSSAGGDAVSWDARLVQAVNFSPTTSESFRVLRAKILMPPDGRPTPRTILVTSVQPQEGKSFVAANLGVMLAQGIDQYALLVDCDLRLPTMAELFGLPREGGLADYLRHRGELSSYIRKTSMDKLSVLTSGEPPANPAELLGSTRMQELVAEVSRRYPDRFVVFDCPPLMVASEAITLANVVDAVILVVREGVASKTLLQQAVADIGKEKILGVVFNGHRPNPVASRVLGKNSSYYENYYYRRPAR